jgi:N-acetylglucosamine kinase-like BadF-type ATPase
VPACEADMPDLFVGVDGGGTHARAVVTDAAGVELARRTGPAGLIDPREPAAAAAVVAQLAREALRSAGARRARALCCGLAGARRQQERDAVRVALVIEDLADDVHVVGDAAAAMADAFPVGGGVLVIAGTGSIAWASDGGEPLRIGGWGQLLGDEGSGYAIALAALRAVTRCADRAEDTLLTAVALRHAGVERVHDLISWTAAARKAEIAALAPQVLQCAADGDAAACAIRAQAVSDIVDLATTAARRLAGRVSAFALAGGLIAPGGPLRDEVIAALTARAPGAIVSTRPVDAALGAARLARGRC